METRELKKHEINKFIDFGDSLYINDSNYVPYIRLDLRKTIKSLVFQKAKYKALCCFDSSGVIVGRILLTVMANKQLNTEHCGYFSFAEFINDYSVFCNLFDKAIETLKVMGAEYILGSFFPHDPDNRRGVLIRGFEKSPMIFTSHNPEYYPVFFEKYGFKKLTDAFEYEYVENREILEKIKTTAEKALKENDIYISKLNYNNLDKDIDDAHKIMEIASTSVNFEKVISKEELKKIFMSWRIFINPDYAFMARKKSDDSPVGFTLSIPDYFELIKRMKGRVNLRGIFIFLNGRKKIKGLRAILQYIVPEYQHKGISKALYYETKKSIDKNNITRIALGTIMEANDKSNGAIRSIGGELSRVYRVYYKQI